MSSYLPFVVVGLVTGAIYGLAGIGLVLTYKTSGIFNFAHGAVAAFGAFFFYWLNVDRGLHWAVAMAITVIGLGTATGFVMERLARHLSKMSTTLKIVATVGIVLLVQGLSSLKYKPGSALVPAFLPQTRAFRLFEVTVSKSDVIVMVTGIALAAALFAFFRFSRMGVAMRGVVDDPDLLDLSGTNPAAVRRWSWVIGTVLAMLSGILISQGGNLDAVALTFLVVQAFGAAAIGAFSSLPLTYLGGTIIGLAVALGDKQFSSNKYLKGFPNAAPVIVLFVMLLLLPKRKLVTAGAAARFRSATAWKAPPRVRMVAGVLVLGVLLLVPQLVGTKLDGYAIALTYVMLFLSLGLLVKTSGQVSLCHMAFAAVGAATFSQFSTQHHWPWLVAILASALVAIPVGALIAIPAIRLSGLYLALATLGFGIVMQRAFYPLGFLFGVQQTGRPTTRPSIFGTDKAFYYVILAFVVVSALVMVAIHEGRLGRLLRGLGDSPTALSTLGLSVNATRVIVFCISAFFAAMSGALYGSWIHNVNGRQFDPFKSLVLVALLALNPLAEPWYGFIAAIGLQIVPLYFNDVEGHVSHWLNVLFGVFALIVALQGGNKPAPAGIRAKFERFRRKRVLPDSPVGGVSTVHRAAQGDGLTVQNLVVRFGGLVAVDGLSFSAPVGRITGLIGPNGAGKTTTFNACSGLNAPSSGRILFHGQDVSSKDAPARARRGLGRTFQTMELFDSLSVAVNVGLGREAGLAGARPHAQLVASPSHKRETVEAANEAMRLCGIEHLADRLAGDLSTGERRLVELARCLAGRFDLLLLDEPSSGLDRDETARFGQILRQVVAERGVGILLVEHDMSLVMDVCSYIYVLDFGRLIFEGTPVEIAASPIVRHAYLGATELEEELSHA